MGPGKSSQNRSSFSILFLTLETEMETSTFPLFFICNEVWRHATTNVTVTLRPIVLDKYIHHDFIKTDFKATAASCSSQFHIVCWGKNCAGGRIQILEKFHFIIFGNHPGSAGVGINPMLILFRNCINKTEFTFFESMSIFLQ